MLISIGIIALNEEEYLPALLEDILQQTFPCSQIDLLLIDSVSSDKTKTIMEQFGKTHREVFHNIRVIDNVGKWLANGWNVFIDNAEGDILIKVDAHSKIPQNFISLLVDAILKDNQDVVGGKRPTILKDSNVWSRILLEAENALFGSGFAVFRTSDKARYVKSVFHGAYRKEVFEKVGLFNEKLRRTEDNEIHYRIRRAGYKIKYDPSIVSYQYARPTLLKMLKQKYLNGYWIGKTIWISPFCFSIYHFVPLAFVVSLICAILLLHNSFMPLIILGSLYGAFDLLNTVLSVIKNKNPQMFMLILLFPMLHISYGMGTLLGLLPFPRVAANN